MEALDTLDRFFAEQMGPSSQPFYRRLMAHSRKGHLCMRSGEDIVSEKMDVIRDKNRYYLHRNWVLETTILQQLQRLLQSAPKEIFERSAFSVPSQLHEKQAEAVRRVLTQSLTVVSGGPGTGKTYTAGQLVQALMMALGSTPLRVKIAAPTGKAADRLAQAIVPMERLQVEAMTLHRLLGLQPGRCRLFEERRIDADLILIDEASMIDASLFAHLLSAVPNGARIVLFGDADQLPPIDGGGIFADLAEMLSIRLEICHRTQDASVHNIYEAVRKGHVNPLYNLLEPLPQDLIGWIESILGNLAFSEKPAMADLIERFDRLRVICPLRKGPLGIDAINRALLHRLQKRLVPGQWWAAPILVTNNDASLQLYNGTSGVVLAQYRGGALVRGFEEAFISDGRSFPLFQLPGYEIALALSVHKSQGSEFDQVVCCLPQGSEEFAREALYTALTRAKKKIRLAGDQTTLDAMMNTRSRQENGLRERMEKITLP
ncbi:MAG: Exodeoxyribonuclease alpha chain [Parachlamydiales bacterium]|nr:Exodeoxyribonuclease alpha chain [Parachlamydiales bacterium]